MKNTIQHHNNFHLLRHIAAFFVLYAHAITVNGTEEPLYHLLKPRIELSSLGVEIFFIISGYLVTQSLLQTPGRWQFIRKRWLRLWPALCAVTFLLCFVLGPFFTKLSLADYFAHGQTWHFLLRNLMFLPVYTLPGVLNGHDLNTNFWTLSFEIVCYGALVLAGKTILIKYKNMIAVLWAAIACYKYFLPVILSVPQPIKPYWYGISNMMFLFFSSCLWFLFTNKKVLAKKVWMIALIVFTAAVVLPLPPLPVKCLRDASLLIFIIEWGRSKPLINWPRWDISYGTYLMAYTVEVLLVSYFPAPAFVIFILTLIITVPLAFALWYGVEQPFLRKK